MAASGATEGDGLDGLDAAAANERYGGRLRQEVAAYRQVTNVHDLPAIYGYWNAGHVDPLFAKSGFGTFEEFFVGPLRRACASRPHAHFVSLGSGNGDLELGLAQKLVAAGIANFTFDRLELNDAMRERAALDATEAGLADRFVDTAADLNRWEAEHAADVVVANHSLHHVVDLEHLFAQVRAALGADGVFVVNDMIGRNGHMRWPEALDLVQRIWAVMPDRYRYNQQLGRHEPEYENWDCSTEGFEGIRAQDILPLLNQTFHAETFLAFANVVDLFVDRGFGHNFDPDRADDRAFIDAVAHLDEAALELGVVKPTHLAAHFRTVPVPCRFLEPFSPAWCVRPPATAAPATGAVQATAEPEPANPVLPPAPRPVNGALRLLAELVPPIRRLRQQRDALAAEVVRLRAGQVTTAPS